VHEGISIDRAERPRPAAAEHDHSRARTVAAVAALVAVGSALRLLGARGDLWLDELWSIGLAGEAGSLLGVFTRLHHDNNHHLNTLWLMLIGPGASPLAYRIPALVAGAGTIVVAAFTPIHGGRAERLAITTLVALSYFLVHYGSEARGFAPALLFGMLAYHALQRYLRPGGRPAWVAVYAIAATLGLASHATFVFLLAGATAWAVLWIGFHWRAARWPTAALALLLVPVAAAGALWWVALRHLVIGGGPPSDLRGALRELSRATLGLPSGPIELVAVLAWGAAALELLALAWQRDARAVFFAGTIVVAPAATLLWRRPEYLAPRYFAIPAVFLLLLLGAALGRLAAMGRAGRAVFAVAALVLACTSIASDVRLARLGRGDFRGGVEFILASSPGPFTTVGSDNDWRNPVVLEDQLQRLGAMGRIRYLPIDSWTPSAPAWVLVHDDAVPPRPEPFLTGPNLRTYALVQVFPYAGLSGWNWFVYRLTDLAPLTGTAR
jgi:hypothetical protein